MTIPPSARLLFGEAQTPASLMAIATIGTGVAVAFYAIAGGFEDLPSWRKWLALALVFDIASGCVANFTPGTKAYYRSRRRLRWIFIGVHLHPIAIAALLGWPPGPSGCVWLYTIITAALVNAVGDRWQFLTAGCALVAGLVVAVFLAGGGSPMMLVAQLFMTKMIIAFAVTGEAGSLTLNRPA